MEAQVDAQLRRELRDIVELARQAEALSIERRYVRAAKRSAAAAERARLLAALGENSVVVAQLQAQHAQMLLTLVQARVWLTEPLPATGNDMDTRAAAEQALELLLSAVSVIRHRRAAGTLIRGACRAAEVAHARAEFDSAISAGEFRAENVPVGLAGEVGEVAALKVGIAALGALGVCSHPPVQMLLSDSHLDSSALGIFATYVRETLDLVVALPRDRKSSMIINFAQSCESAIGTELERVRAYSRDDSGGRNTHAGTCVGCGAAEAAVRRMGGTAAHACAATRACARCAGVLLSERVRQGVTTPQHDRGAAQALLRAMRRHGGGARRLPGVRPLPARLLLQPGAPARALARGPQGGVL